MIMRDKVTFRRNTKVPDGAGGFTDGWADLLTVRAKYKPRRGREVAEGDRTQNVASGVLTIRYSTEASGMTTEDKVVISGQDYQIRDVENPDRRTRYLELVVERGRVD